jgi:hypothetical protein
MQDQNRVAIRAFRPEQPRPQFDSVASSHLHCGSGRIWRNGTARRM